jgi:hypothetical protein
VKLEINGKVYRIVFRYFTGPHLLTLTKKVALELGVLPILLQRGTKVFVQRRQTYCKIVDGNDTIISSGLAVCNPVDQFERDEGRYWSLDRALKVLPTDLLEYSDSFIQAYTGRKSPTELIPA